MLSQQKLGQAGQGRYSEAQAESAEGRAGWAGQEG